LGARLAGGPFWKSSVEERLGWVQPKLPTVCGGLVNLVKAGAGVVRLAGLKARCDDISGTELHARSGESELGVDFEFMADPDMPMPNLALMVYGADGRVLCSTGTWIDGVTLTRNDQGHGRAHLRFPKLPLLKGRYTLSAYLMCERAVHVYEAVEHFASVQVTQPHLEQGVVSIPHQWQPL
jgi:lipopolysaccharide transport system ATP-binding protein